MKTKLLFAFTLFSLIFLLPSCSDDPEPGPIDDGIPTVAFADDLFVTDDNVRITVVPGEYATSYKFAIGLSSDEAAFTEGTLKDIVTVDKNESTTHNFTKLEPSTDYVIFAQAFNSKKGEVVKLNASTSDTPYTLSITDTKVEVGSDYVFYEIETAEKVATVKHIVAERGLEQEFIRGELSDVNESTPASEKVSGARAGLDEESEYSIYAQAFGPDGQAGQVVVYNFGTGQPLEYEVDIYMVRDEYIVFRVTPDEDIRYVKYTLGGSGMETEFATGDMEGITDMDLYDEDEMEEEDFEFTPIGIEIGGLDKGTDYTLYVQGYSEDGRRGKLYSFDITTMTYLPKVFVEVSDITVGSYNVHTIPEEGIQFYLVFGATVDYMGHYINGGAEKVVLEVQDQFLRENADMLLSEYTLPWQGGLQVEKDFVVTVVAYDERNRPFYETIQYEYFRMPDYDPNAPVATMNGITVSDITSNSVSVSFEMGPDAVAYFGGVLKYNEDSYESERSMSLWIKSMLYEFYIFDYDFEYNELTPSTEYRVWAYPMGANGEDSRDSGKAVYYDAAFTTLGEGEQRAKGQGLPLKKAESERPFPKGNLRYTDQAR